MNIDFCFVSEPAAIPNSRCWLSSLDGLAAFVWSPQRISSCVLVHRGEKFVAVRCMDTLMVACYCSPNTDIASFLDLLDGMESFLNDPRKSRKSRNSSLICGDFNAKSVLWDAYQDMLVVSGSQQLL